MNGNSGLEHTHKHNTCWQWKGLHSGERMSEVASAIIIFCGLILIVDEIKQLRESIATKISRFELGYQIGYQEGVKEKNRDR